jgi:energy-coupling factor transporter ATP-binding protein EcfA2
VGELLLVTGPPGAGKSTVARLLSAGFERSALVAGDAFFAFLDQGFIAPWLPGSETQNEVVTRAAAAAAGQLAAGGLTVVYEGVVGPWLLPTFLEWCGMSAIHYAILLPSEATCLHRVRTRVGHGFDDPDATRSMHQQFDAAPVDHRHVLAPPPDTAEDTARLVRARMDDGYLRIER